MGTGLRHHGGATVLGIPPSFATASKRATTAAWSPHLTAQWNRKLAPYISPPLIPNSCLSGPFSPTHPELQEPHIGFTGRHQLDTDAGAYPRLDVWDTPKPPKKHTSPSSGAPSIHPWLKPLWNLRKRPTWNHHKVTMSLPGLSPQWEGKQVLFVSDFHINPWDHPDYWLQVLKHMGQNPPDIVLFGGDLINFGTEELDRAREILSAIPSKTLKLAVLGNHDYWDGADGAHVTRALQKAGFQVLSNKALEVDGLWFSGVDDATTDRADPEQAYQTIPPGAPHIGLSHNPMAHSQICEQPNGPQLLLCGHTHGNIIPWIGERANRWINQWLEEKTEMRYFIAYQWLEPPYPTDTQIYVTSGLGHSMTWHHNRPQEESGDEPLLTHSHLPPIRLKSSAEMVTFTLTRSQTAQ